MEEMREWGELRRRMVRYVEKSAGFRPWTDTSDTWRHYSCWVAISITWDQWHCPRICENLEAKVLNFERTMFWCVRLVRVANHRRLRFAWICETGTLSGSFAYIIVAFVVVHLMNLPLDDILAHLLKFTVEKFCHVLFIVMSKHNHWFLLDL